MSGPFSSAMVLTGPQGPAGPALTTGAQGYFLFSDSLQTQGLGWGRPFDLIDLTKEYGYTPATSAASGTTKLQTACNDSFTGQSGAVGYGALWLPPGTYSFDGTITVKSGLRLWGSGNDGSSAGPILQFFGGATADGFVNDVTNYSGFHFAGWRLEDHRTTPTSGHGFKLNGASNGSLFERMCCHWAVVSSATASCIYFSGDNLILRDLWLLAASRGIWLDLAVENVVLENVKGDVTVNGGDMVYASGAAALGYVNLIMRGLKTENQSFNPNLVHVGPTFKGSVSLTGGFVEGGTGTVLLNDSATLYADISNIGAGGVLGALVSDTVSGRKWGDEALNSSRNGSRIVLNTLGASNLLGGAVFDTPVGSATLGDFAACSDSGTNPTCSIDSTSKVNGVRSAKVIVVGDATGQGIQSGATTNAVEVGKTYTFRANASGAGTVTARIKWRDSGGSLLSTVTGAAVVLASGITSAVSLSATAPASAAYAQVQVVTSVQAAGTFYLKDVELAALA